MNYILLLLITYKLLLIYYYNYHQFYLAFPPCVNCQCSSPGQRHKNLASRRLDAKATAAKYGIAICEPIKSPKLLIKAPVDEIFKEQTPVRLIKG